MGRSPDESGEWPRRASSRERPSRSTHSSHQPRMDWRNRPRSELREHRDDGSPRRSLQTPPRSALEPSTCGSDSRLHVRSRVHRDKRDDTDQLDGDERGCELERHGRRGPSGTGVGAQDSRTSADGVSASDGGQRARAPAESWQRNQSILAAVSARQLLDLHQQHGHAFDEINLTTC